MSMWRCVWCAIIVSVTLILMAACAPTPQGQTPTATSTDSGAVAVAGQGGTGGNGGGGTPSPSPSPTQTATPTSTPTPTPTETPTPQPALPYVVKQTHSVGGETISGEVCSLTQPFIVNSQTPKVTFNFNFGPTSASQGTLSYAYSVPGAGESDDAHGTYKVTPAGTADGTLVLAMTVSDHVVFHGFDGNIPLKYDFDLVPSTQTHCPLTP